MTKGRIGPKTRKKNFLARAYGFKVPQMFVCDECNEKFQVVQRDTEIDELDYFLKSAIKSNWFDVKLKVKEGSLIDEDLCYFFYFDCPYCAKRFFTEVYSSSQSERLGPAKFWDNLIGFERDLIDTSDTHARKARAKMEEAIKRLEEKTTGSYVKDSVTGLYSMVRFYHD